MTRGDLNTSILSALDSTTGAATTTGGGGKNSSGNSSMSRGRIQYCLKIGQALKQVDRTLFQEWLNWCNQTSPLYTPSDTHTTNNNNSMRNSISTSILKEERENNRGSSIGSGEGSGVGRMSTQLALTAWDYFEPQACDVHSATYSQVYSLSHTLQTTVYVSTFCILCVYTELSFTLGIYIYTLTSICICTLYICSLCMVYMYVNILNICPYTDVYIPTVLSTYTNTSVCISHMSVMCT